MYGQATFHESPYISTHTWHKPVLSCIYSYDGLVSRAREVGRARYLQGCLGGLLRLLLYDMCSLRMNSSHLARQRGEQSQHQNRTISPSVV